MSVLAEEHLGVVVVDDDPVFRDLICATVAKKSKFVMFEAGSGDELGKILDHQRVDCIVLDYDLGRETGLTLKQRIDTAYPGHPPTIMMTADGRESTAIRAFRMGIDDYIPKKGLRPEFLVASVLSVVERDRHASLARAEHRRLVAASAIDIVTGLEGRPRLDERLAHLASLSESARASYAVVLIELVEYPDVMVHFGLKVSDRVLRHFGKVLQQLTRSNDVCGRYQDGTFLVIADVRNDPATLDQMRRRFTEGLSLRFSLDAADLVLSARVAGARCTPAPLSKGAVPVDLIAGALVDLERARAREPSPPQGDHDAIGSALIVESQTPMRESHHDLNSRPAADELRTVNRRHELRHRVFKRGLIHIMAPEH